MILFSRRALDARAGIHAPGMRQRDGQRHVGSVQTAGHDDWPGSAGGKLPVERLTRAAEQFARRSIQQQRFGGAIAKAREIEIRAHAHGFPHRERSWITVRRFLAVQLRHVERRCARDLLDARRRFIDEHTHAPHARRRHNFRRPLRRDVARAARIEIETDGGGAALNRRGGVLLVGDAADLDDHAATRFRARGSVAKWDRRFRLSTSWLRTRIGAATVRERFPQRNTNVRAEAPVAPAVKPAEPRVVSAFFPVAPNVAVMRSTRAARRRDRPPSSGARPPETRSSRPPAAGRYRPRCGCRFR